MIKRMAQSMIKSRDRGVSVVRLIGIAAVVAAVPFASMHAANMHASPFEIQGDSSHATVVRTAAKSPGKKSPGKHKSHGSSSAKSGGKSTANGGKNAKAAPPPSPAFTVPPLPNAILPKKRIVAFYGNPLSKRMGVLGEYPENVMLAKLQGEIANFSKADPSKPVVGALHLIVAVAQGSPGRKGLYRIRMTDSLIDRWCKLAESKGYLMFLDVQVGRSTVQSELQPLIPYLKRPYVHLALDPEFDMKGENVPGRKIGTMSADEVNYAIQTLETLVRQNNLPPKILVVHRFTNNMLTHYREIRPVPSVQVVINMDGFGQPWLKRDSYNDYVRMQPVQYTGFKLFYKNDKPRLSADEVVKLDPSPVFITFQ